MTPDPDETLDAGQTSEPGQTPRLGAGADLGEGAARPDPAPDVAPEATAPVPDAAAGVPAGHRRRIWSFLKQAGTRPAVADPTPPPPPVLEERDPYPLLRRSPFVIGFLGAVGAMTAVGLASALTQLTSIIVLVVVALFLALGLNPLVEELVLRGLRRPLAVGIVAVGGLLIVVLGSTALVPVVTSQVELLLRNTPRYLAQLRSNERIAQFDAQYQVLARATEFLTSGSLINNVFGGLLGWGMVLFNAVFSVFMTVVLTVYFLFSLETIKDAIYQLSPASRRQRTRYIAGQVFRRIGGYLTGMFILVTCASVGAFVMMLLVGLGEYALALAFVVAVCWFIPLVGGSAAAVVVSLVGFTQSPTVGIICIIYFAVYINVDAYLINPRVMARQVNVPGALVVVAALAGGTLLGVVGALLAVPTVAVLLVLYREILVPHLEST